MKMLMVEEKEYASVLSYKLMFDSGNYIIKPRGGMSPNGKIQNEEFKEQFEGFDYNNIIIHDGENVYLPQTEKYEIMEKGFDQ